MKIKNFFFIIFLSFIFSVGFLGVNVNAQTTTTTPPTFPAGCSSALGYSITNGLPCSGTGTATVGPLPGCTTALGYSTTNGVPCSGGTTAINFLAGCSSIYGYSTITGSPCNGTSTVSNLPGTGTGGTGGTPGLPTTGDGGNSFNNLLLMISSGLIALVGVSYIVFRRTNTV